MSQPSQAETTYVKLMEYFIRDRDDYITWSEMKLIPGIPRNALSTTVSNLLKCKVLEEIKLKKGDDRTFFPLHPSHDTRTRHVNVREHGLTRQRKLQHKKYQSPWTESQLLRTFGA